MDRIPVELLCPICLDFPENEAYQCGQGHLICSKCIANLQKCPQCLHPFEDPKIRNRVAESLLESYKLECPHKHLGCDTKLLKDKLETHAQTCVYGGERLNICREFDIECETLVNIRDVTATVEHLKSHRYNEIFTKPTIQTSGLLLNYHKLGKNYWSPTFLHFQDKLFLLKAGCHEQRQFEISWFELSPDWEMKKSKYQVEMTIRDVGNKGRDLKWTLPIAALLSRNGRLISSEFRVSSDLIFENYTKNGALPVKCRIINLPDNSIKNSSPPPQRICMDKGNCVIS